MSIVNKEEKKQKRLIYLLVIVLIITALVLWFGFFRPSPRMGPIGPIGPMGPIGQMGQMGQMGEIEQIDFAILESPFLKELKPFKGIEPFEKEIGRENPFIPY